MWPATCCCSLRSSYTRARSIAGKMQCHSWYPSQNSLIHFCPPRLLQLGEKEKPICPLFPILLLAYKIPLCGHRMTILGDNKQVVLGHTYDYVEAAIQLADTRFVNTRCFAWCFFSNKVSYWSIILVEVHLSSNLARHTNKDEESSAVVVSHSVMYLYSNQSLASVCNHGT